MSSETEFIKCRLCLNRSEYLYSIFDSHFISNISDKIEKYSGIKISQDDCFPHSICNVCIDELKLIDKFIEKCRNSDEKLREEVEIKVKDEVEHLNEDDYWVDVKMEEEDDLPIIKFEELHRKEVRSTKKHKSKHRLKKKNEKNGKVKKESCGACVCNTCGLQVKSRSAMEIHWRVHSGEKPYECTVCLKKFSQKNTLRIHTERRHNTNSIQYSHCTPDRRFYCETCGKAFKSRTSLKIHLRVHSDERPYKCNECDRRFTQLGSLSVHQRRHRGERPYSCNICQKTFVEMTHLKRHMSVHSDARPYICSICGKGVKSPFALKQHLKLHSNSKEHVCDKCGMSFTIKGSLDSHVRVVHSEKSGQCLICNKICSNLDDHMTLHSGEKPHCCGVCSKRFSRKRGLIIHSKQHTEEGKYQCNVPGCGKTFYAQWVLECHILKHTGNTPFVCKLCKKGFVRVCHLTKHMKINHPNDEIRSNNIT